MSAKVMSDDTYVELYVKSKSFIRSVDGRLAIVRAEVSKLNDPVIRDGMKGGEGDAALETLDKIGGSLQNYSDKVAKIASFVDIKLGQLDAVKAHNSGFDAAGQDAEKAGQMSLKK